MLLWQSYLLSEQMIDDHTINKNCFIPSCLIGLLFLAFVLWIYTMLLKMMPEGPSKPPKFCPSKPLPWAYQISNPSDMLEMYKAFHMRIMWCNVVGFSCGIGWYVYLLGCLEQEQLCVPKWTCSGVAVYPETHMLGTELIKLRRG